MKSKILTLSAAMLFALVAKAQFTITQNNVPTRFNEEYRINDTLVASSISPGNTGAGQTWDFSALHAHTRDTTTYMSPSGTPDTAVFPQANLVQYSRKNGYIYINVTNSYFGILGAYQNNPGVAGGKISPKFKPVFKAFVFPSTYLSSFKDTQIFKITFYYGQKMGGITIDSVRVKHRAYGDNIIDAYGKMITPIVTYNNTMRRKEYTITTDSVEGYSKLFGTWQLLPNQPTRDTSTTYSWYSDQYRLSVVQLGYKGKNLKFAGANYLTNLSKATGVKEPVVLTNNIKVFPNPSASELNIQISETHASNVFIYDITGKKIAMLDARFNKNLKINTENFAEGLYLYKVTDNEGATLNTGKFSVARQ